MDRRLAGALLVIAVLAVAVVMPLLGGQRTTGTAQPVAVPRDPRMGDCLLQRPEGIGPPRGQPFRAAAGSTSPATVSRPLGATLGSCENSAVAAEVVLTVSAAGDIETRQRKVAETGIDCHAAALRYAGLGRFADGVRPATVTAQQAADDPVGWRMSINIRTAWVFPSPFLRAAGRIWAACVVAPPRDATYRGTLAEAFTTGRLPDEYGTCWNAPVVTPAVESVDCRQPHLSELLSVGVITERTRVTTEGLRESCRRLAIAAVGRQDPTDAGRLVLKTTPARMYASGLDRSVNVSCYLTSAGPRLSGTLMGLRNHPVPFAG
jgi:hypothetical protein